MAMNIKAKYEAARPRIKNGDLVLFRGRRLLARTIQFFDDAYYNHIGVVFKSGDHLLIMDSNREGVRPDFLSNRIRKYKDFCIVSPKKPEAEVSEALQKSFSRGDIGTRYDFLLLPRIAIIKKTGIDFSGLGSDRRDICSEFVRYYTDCLQIKCYRDIKLITPQDFLRHRDSSEMDVLFDNSNQ